MFTTRKGLLLIIIIFLATGGYSTVKHLFHLDGDQPQTAKPVTKEIRYNQ